MKTALTNMDLSRGEYDWRIPLGTFLLICGLYLPLVLMQEFIARDVALRYAPMADAFCRGDWKYAFHPRVQCLHPLTAGIFSRLLDCPGSLGAQLASLFVFALCAFPLYSLLKSIFKPSTALWGTLCLPLLSSLVLICTNGLREPYKILCFLILARGFIDVYRFRSRLWGYGGVALGCGLAFVIRNDAVISALFLTFAAGVLEFTALKSLKRSAGMLVFILFFAGIECAVNYFVCGQAVPGTHFFVLFKKLFGMEPGGWRFWAYMVLPGCLLYFAGIVLVGTGIRYPNFRRLLWCLVGLFLAGMAGRILYVAADTPAGENWRFFRSIKNGLYPALFYLTMAGIWHQWRQKKWDILQSLLAGIFLCCFLGPLALCLFWENKFYVSDRYLQTGTILFTGWAVIGIGFLWGQITRWFAPWGKHLFFFISIIIFPLGCLRHAYSRVWDEKFYIKEIRRLAEIREIADTIRSNYRGEKFTAPHFDIYFYQSNARPRVFCSFPGKKQLAAYFSGGSLCVRLRDADFVLGAGEPAGGKWQQIGKEKFQLRQRKK